MGRNNLGKTILKKSPTESPKPQIFFGDRPSPLSKGLDDRAALLSQGLDPALEYIQVDFDGSLHLFCLFMLVTEIFSIGLSVAIKNRRAVHD